MASITVRVHGDALGDGGDNAAALARSFQDRGNAAAEAGDFAEAIRHFECAVETHASGRLYESLAQCFLLMSLPQQAVDAATRAVELDGSWSESHFTLGRALAEVGRLEGALAEFRAASALDPGNEDVADELLRADRELRVRARRSRVMQDGVEENRQSKYDRRIFRAKRRRHPRWSEADWTIHGIADAELPTWATVSDEGILRVASTAATRQDFGTTFQATSTPAVLHGCMVEWPAMTQWTVEAFVKAFGQKKVVCDHRIGLCLRMADFAQYMREQRDDTPLYVFDHTLADHAATRHLAEQYMTPDIFTDDILERLPPTLRPPLRWLLIGPKRSGSFLHKDPLGTSAWNALISGTKLWVLFPPGTPSHMLKPEKCHATAQESAACWFLQWWTEMRQQSRQWSAEHRPVEFVQRPGEVVFVPARWWHTVLNLEDTIAVTHNFCNRWNARQVWLCTSATHPILAKHVRKCIGEAYPDMPEDFFAAPPDANDAHDAGEAYAIPEETLAVRRRESHERYGTSQSSSERDGSSRSPLPNRQAKARKCAPERAL